ncbi:hypothetical protein TNIN_269131 [Trichonephila inaurata madagascariensis]|uniref:Uncharacterized protein n=1 Tax=Trichonephila inaurata madagascariensis TaxID=2747483 RepID=A0A8X6I893_9ARAC|nr:hypothetical protein TNIN_269131 [Trichonephila inaurata madagascariensis]
MKYRYTEFATFILLHATTSLRIHRKHFAHKVNNVVKHIPSPYPEFPPKRIGNVLRENISVPRDQSIGPIIAVSALIAMFSVPSSFGKARNHDRRTLKQEDSIYVFRKQICFCL